MRGEIPQTVECFLSAPVRHLVTRPARVPRSVTNAIGAVEYLEVKTKGGRIILTPVRIRRADAVRGRLTKLDIARQDIAKT